MGRSVSYPSGPNTVVTFGHIDEEIDEFVWDMYVDDFRQEVKRLFPSTYQTDDWIGREDHVLMENGHAQFGMSEYCGMVSYWMVPKEDAYGYVSPLAEHWVDQAGTRFSRAFGTLQKVGTFSNGGGIYAPINGHDPGPDNFDTKPYTISGMVTDG